MCKNETEINIKNVFKKNNQTKNKSNSHFTKVTLNGRTFDLKRYYHKSDFDYSFDYAKFIPRYLFDFYATK